LLAEQVRECFSSPHFCVVVAAPTWLLVVFTDYLPGGGVLKVLSSPSWWSKGRITNSFPCLTIGANRWFPFYTW